MEAAESAAEVLENALRVQGRLEATLRKLAALSPSKGSSEEKFRGFIYSKACTRLQPERQGSR